MVKLVVFLSSDLQSKYLQPLLKVIGWLKLDDSFGWTRRSLTSGFLKLWFTVLVFTALSPLHCFIIVLKLILMMFL